MCELAISDAWKETYPGASIGILTMRDVHNPVQHPALAERKAELERDIRAGYAGYDRAKLKALPVLQAYTDYYKRFRKTYHVQLQLESVAFKGKPIPSVAALVEAMFMAELRDLLLTSGHDLEAVQPPISIDVADGSERFVRMDGQEQQTKPDDMIISDSVAILSSVIYGPDRRTQIGPETRQVLFTTYAPPGIEPETVRQHLQHIRDYVLLVAPEAQVTQLKVYGTKTDELV
jgi:DNA/RNA-binding domain of Phe-tRNA-synthetase-like protein